MQTFDDLGLSPELSKALGEIGFINPTEIQQKSIPELLERNPDFIGLAQTGTGKTAAFGVPLIAFTDTNIREIQSVILAPTRELVQQIAKELKSFARYTKKIEIEVVYGGTPINRQMRSLQNKTPHILVATPGRLIDLINRKVIKLNKVNHAVLDEADEMLNMGFQEDIDRILSYTPAEKRTWLFSATMPGEIRKIVGKYMQDPVEVSIGQIKESNENIEHQYVVVKGRDKRQALKRLIDFYPDLYGVVFCRTKAETKNLASDLISENYPAEALHGDLSQEQRDSVMRKFRAGSIRILIATDVAARGIDVDNLTHVIHYTLPDDKLYYTHRSGRTARAGKKGISIAIATTEDTRKLRFLQSFIGGKLKKIQVPGKEMIAERKVQLWAQNILEAEAGNVPEDILNKGLEIFENISKEELVRKILAAEIGKLNWQKEKEDINASEKKERRREEKSDGRRDMKRGGRREEKKGGRRDSGKSDQKMHRFFINLGSVDKLEKSELLNLIIDQANLSKDQIGKIEMKKVCSYFEVDADQSRKISSAFKDISHKGRKLRVNRDHPSN